jgi:hypothetical protein
MSFFAEGENYRITLDNGVAVCRVWKRPDLTREQGAQCAAEKVLRFEKLTSLPSVEAAGLVLDMRDAPEAWGPSTNRSIAEMLGVWQRAGRRVAVLVSGDALQSIAMEKVCREASPICGKVVTTWADGLAWIEYHETPPRSR